MKLNFESNLEHQIKAIQSVVGLLDGQSKTTQESTIQFQVKGNSIGLSESEIQNNLNKVILSNGLILIFANWNLELIIVSKPRLEQVKPIFI